jgi:prostaglandin-endoperoxide synthase 2
VRNGPFSSLKSRVAGLVLVTVIEGLGVYWWLRFQDEGDLGLAFILLFGGELLETATLGMPLGRAQTPIPVGDPFGARRHRRRFAAIFFVAFVAELAIWTAWLWVATDIDLPIIGRGYDEPLVGAAVLLVTMHLKHQLEASALLDFGYFKGFWRCTAGSIAEVAGAAWCLALIEDDKLVLAAGALALGFLVEHWLLVYRQLYRAVAERDISVPRPSLPPERLVGRLAGFVAKRTRLLSRFLQSFGPIDRFLNWLAIDRLVKRVPPRPNPVSTKAAYTSWGSLIDRTYSGRYLPPTKGLGHPPVDDVAALFRRDDKIPDDEIALCPKSTVLFTSFAQWFVDGFLRTERTKGALLRNTRRNESGHDIDLAQLYGLDGRMTNVLREHSRGRLCSQIIEDEEYPPYLCCGGRIRLKYLGVLPTPIGFERIAPADRDRMFAMGTDVHSLGFTAFNVLFLREHNRIAAELERSHPTWSDERLFDTTRIILIVVLLKVVVEDYINHIAASYFRFRLPAPATFARAPWFRQNWMAIEFNLLYRWHSLVPPKIKVGGCKLDVERMLVANDVLIAKGLRTFMLDASAQRAGRIGLFNNDPHLVDTADKPSIEQARIAQLRSYNDYRELSSLPRLRSFSEFSTDKRVGPRLHDLYDHVDDVEYYVGLFAEEAGLYEVLPKLMLTMVSFDALSQLVTNPLLAPRVYGPDAFTATGLDIIDSSDSIATLIRRNVPSTRKGDYFSLTRKDYDGP